MNSVIIHRQLWTEVSRGASFDTRSCQTGVFLSQSTGKAEVTKHRSFLFVNQSISLDGGY